ncbi:MAG: ABC-2 family transporter protein [Patescibacteria group bacterium]
MGVKRYIRLFRQAAVNRFALYAASRADLVTFIFGKLLRLGFFVILAVSLFNHTNTIVGYSEGQVLMLFAMMNMIDMLTQALWYRGMYNIKDWIRRGKFDMFLVQPVSPLFKTAAMQLDLFDFITLPVGIAYIIVAWTMLPTQPTLLMAISAAVLFLFSIVIAFSINLCMASVAFWTTENESAWALYRDSVYVARFPIEIFPNGFRAFFTFVIPVLAIVSFPAKTLMGLASPHVLLWGAIIAFAWLALGLTLWRAGLRHYTSASG